MNDGKFDLTQYCQDSAKVINRCCALEDEISLVVAHIIEAFRWGRKLIVFGNGGSASMAEHFVAELVGRFEKDGRRPLPAIAITSNSSVMTALINDFRPALVFWRQVEALANPGDVVFGISTSGISENVVEALRSAHERKCVQVLLTSDRCSIKHPAWQVIRAPSRSTPLIQQAHLVIIHALCHFIDEAFTNDTTTTTTTTNPDAS